MAVPSYTEDLTDITTAEATTGFSAYGGGQSGLDQNADISMQGTYCVAKQITAADKGMYYSGAQTLAAGDHVWIWHFCGTPGLTDTIQNKGSSVLIGSDASNYCQYHVEGNDTYGAAGRIARCYPIDYSLRTTNATPPYRTATGTPTASTTVFGGGLVTTASVKGFNVGIDAMRFGTGAYMTAGELISAGDASDDPCSFAGFQATNDAIANRWSILTEIGGGYELQGRFVVGQTNAGTPTLARFKDSDRSIAFVDTIHAASDLTQIILDHASTRVEWTNINLTALGTTNRGRVTINANNPTVIVDGGTWTGVGPTTLRAATTLDGTTIRASDQITQNGATIVNALIDNNFATSAILTSNTSAISATAFISGGTGHAFEATVAGTYSLSDCTYSGYASANGSTGNEVYYNNSGGAITLNVSGGNTPTIRNGAGATTTVVSTVDITLTGMKDNTEVRVYTNGTTTEIAGIENVTAGTIDDRTFTFSSSPDDVIDIKVFNINWIADRIIGYVVPGTNASIPIAQRIDRVYDNA